MLHSRFRHRADGMRAFALTLLSVGLLCAQTDRVEVPQVRCKSDSPTGAGQLRQPPPVLLPREDAGKLTYFFAAVGIGILGPRDWKCYAMDGSAGTTMYIVPAVDPATGKPERSAFDGPIIEALERNSGTAGRFDVAEVISRMFPRYRDFVETLVAELSDLSYASSPYPRDVLQYKSDSVVMFTTPGGAQGMGTLARVRPNEKPVEGLAMVAGTPEAPYIYVVRTRVDPALAPVILAQAEQDARVASGAGK